MPEVIVIEPRKVQQTAKKRVCAYARVSTERESQMDSYEFQINYYRDKIMSNPDWTLVDIYSDQGITGTSAQKRPGFQQMIKDCQAGEIDTILVKSVSRFARNTVEGLFYIRELKKPNVNVVFEKENIDTGQVNSELWLSFYNSMAEEETHNISRHIRWGYHKRMETGAFITACAPYGFTLINKTLVVEEVERPVVIWIYDRFLNGKTCEEIAFTLNYFAVPKGKNRIWTADGIRYILKNEKYIGDALLQKKISTDVLPYKRIKNNGQQNQYYIENAQEAIIAKETQEKAKRLLQKPEAAVKTDKQKRLLSGYVFCECGTKMRYKTSGEKVYWVCQKHAKDKNICVVKGMEEQSIHQACTTMYHKLKVNYTKVLVPALQQLELLYSDEELYNKSAENDKETMKIMKQIQVLNQLQSKGHYKSAVFMQKIRELTEQLKLIKDENVLQQQKNNKMLQAVRSLIKTIEQGPEHMTILEEDIFKKIVEKIVIREDRTIIFYLSAGFRFEEKVEK